MPELISNLRQSLVSVSTGNIFTSDIIDVLFAALLIYFILILLKQTRSYLILFGITLLGVMFVISRVLNLYLTTLALQAVFNFLFIILIVIFQNEIRQFFELIALLGTRQIKTRKKITSEVSDILSQSAAQFAHEKVGCLIVLPGKDNIDQFIAGGVLSDALVSEEILDSIFDPHSEGHDGALIVNKGRIVKFGSQLPLSTNFKEVGKHGTRHSAAVGLSERCDALCIVVSEEKGTISVAKDGKLRQLDSAQELLNVINKFLKEKFGTEAPSLWNTLVNKNIRLKILALVCAFILWITFAYKAEIVTKEISVPLTFGTLAENTLVEDFTPKDIRVVVSGRGSESVKNISASDLSVNIDSSSLKNGLNAVTITNTSIKKPLNTEIVSFTPNLVYLSVKKYQIVEIPVKVNTTGNPAKNYIVDSISTTPTTVQIWVPDNTNPPGFITTQPLDISNVNDNVLAQVDLVLPAGVKLKTPELTSVSVAVTVRPK